MGYNESVYQARTGTVRCFTRSAKPAQKGSNLLYPFKRIQTIASFPRISICLCLGSKRRKRIGRTNSHRTHLRIMWSSSGSSLPFAGKSRIQRRKNPTCFGYSRISWQYSKDKCIYIRSRSRLSGRSWSSLCHGFCSSQPALRW